MTRFRFMKRARSIYAVIILLLSCTGATAQQKMSQRIDEMAAAEQKAFRVTQQAGLHTSSAASNNFTVSYYRCEWEVDPAERYIKGVITAYITLTAAATSITFDLRSDMMTDSILYQGSKLLFQQAADNSLTIQFPRQLAAGRRDSVSICYQGTPVNDGSGSFVTTLQNDCPLMWTLSEPYGAKDWWPCRNAQSGKADSIDIVLTYPAGYSSSSNGLLVAESITSGKKTSYWKHRYPIASYLVAFAVTRYDTAIDSVNIAGTSLPVRMHAYAGNAGNIAYFRQATEIAMKCLEKFSSLFGPYPFMHDGYSQTQFGGGGGMEHQTNTFIVSAYDQLVAHELAHQWFGDRVTCRSWQDIWLNEGFGQYAQFLYLENFDPAQKGSYLTSLRTKITAQPGGSVKVTDTASPSRIFNGRLSYAKGSALLHMIRWKLGDSLFFKALRQYLSDPLVSYGTAATADLQRNLESISGQSFKSFFQQWYEGEGFPTYQVRWSQNKNSQVRIQLNQATSHPSVSFYNMPVQLGLRGAGRDTLITLTHNSQGQTYWVNAGFAVDTVLFDPQLWLLSGNNTVAKEAAASQVDNDIRVFPNPVHGTYTTVSIANPGGSSILMQLFNSSAQRVYEKGMQLNGADLLVSIPVASLPAGVYWLRIADDKGLQAIRMILR